MQRRLQLLVEDLPAVHGPVLQQFQVLSQVSMAISGSRAFHMSASRPVSSSRVSVRSQIRLCPTTRLTTERPSTVRSTCGRSNPSAAAAASEQRAGCGRPPRRSGRAAAW